MTTKPSSSTLPARPADPEAALADIIRLLAERGRRVRAGDTAKTGAASPHDLTLKPESQAKDDGHD